MHFHKPVDSLMIDHRLSLFPQLPVEYGCNPSVSIGSSYITDLTDKAQIFSIIGLKIMSPCPQRIFLFVLVGSGDPQGICHRFHRISPSSDKGLRNNSFFSRAISSASFSISVSMVFLPSILSSSRILAFKNLTSDSGTTLSSLLTAAAHLIF